MPEIIKVRFEINKLEAKKTIQRIKNKELILFENQKDRQIAKLTKKQRDSIHIKKDEK